MSGHSKWSTIKHKKARLDARRGKVFTKLIREITVAAKMGGGDPEMNPRLRTAIAAGKAANMPLENITRAVKKGTGELEGVIYDEITYEGYGPGGVAILLDTLTDNKNRTAAEVRHVFGKYNGKMAEPGAVAWIFEKRGVIRIATEGLEEDEFMMAALEAGAEDIQPEGDSFQVISLVENFNVVQKNLEADYEFESVGLENLPKTTVAVEESEAAGVLRLLEMLEDLDDAQKVTANFDIDDEVIEKLAEE
ncbi:MAG: YebC/PmpR family DNA-binding transcriptional regulator [Candidatus Krumholzibacteria bacterium]|jgi:YebC/PmpR family DNA-binding regulatory protein|nr:YebC/PmpR family DNA-binding transcriptional regulator [Candidatus Krumholzibacteria bacterium]MDP6796313.1 YebC/PmpR family DNA-binding transcriptional regulator [Candidatus Krumholzibacteria bacterium]MDP7021076.1 YebC/PmpR family DNA-binding transcriptional regulator [Candidatus Krumholzibacteria bacterium]